MPSESILPHICMKSIAFDLIFHQPQNEKKNAETMLKHAETMSCSKKPDRNTVIWPDTRVRGNELLQGHACPRFSSKPFQSRQVPLSGCGLPSKGSSIIPPSLQSIRCLTDTIQDSNKIIQNEDFMSTPGWQRHLNCVVCRFDLPQNVKQNPALDVTADGCEVKVWSPTETRPGERYLNCFRNMHQQTIQSSERPIRV